jgi:hypothetical protein
MLRKIVFKDENVLAFRWEGQFDENAFENAMDEFLPVFRDRHHSNIYIEVVDIEGMDANAVWQDLKFSAGNFNDLIKKIGKVAVVTDSSWLKNLAETSYKLIPGIELKAFNFDESKVAKEWVII